MFSRQGGEIFLREISIDIGIDRRPEVASARLSIALTSELQSRRKRVSFQSPAIKMIRPWLRLPG
jgi:hypothetical protein